MVFIHNCRLSHQRKRASTCHKLSNSSAVYHFLHHSNFYHSNTTELYTLVITSLLRGYSFGKCWDCRTSKAYYIFIPMEIECRDIKISFQYHFQIKSALTDHFTILQYFVILWRDLLVQRGSLFLIEKKHLAIKDIDISSGGDLIWR